MGFALGGPLGALAGAAAGHYIGRFRADAIAAEGIGGSASFSESENSRRQVSFAVAVIVLAAKLAKADGVVTRDEIETFKQVFHIPIHEVDNVGAIFDEAKASPDNFELYAQQIGLIFGNNPAVLEEFLNALFCIAKSDNVVHPAELQYLKEVANIFGFNTKLIKPVTSKEKKQDAPRAISTCLDSRKLEKLIDFNFNDVQSGVSYIFNKSKDL